MEKSIRFIAYTLGLLAVMSLVQTVTANKFADLKERSGQYNADIVSIKTIEKQLDCLAINVYREAGHEPFEGKVGVAQVTMNRVKDGRFGKDVCGVVFQKNVVMEKVVCQFSWVCAITKRIKETDHRWIESLAVARGLLTGEYDHYRYEMGDWLYFHATHVNPKWYNLKREAKIGGHVFYVEKR